MSNDINIKEYTKRTNMFSMPLRKGFSMKVEGIVNFNRDDMHNIAEELGITERDVIMKDGLLIVYNTSSESQEIIDDNALSSFVALALDIDPQRISELTEVEEEPFEMDFSMGDDDEH